MMVLIAYDVETQSEDGKRRLRQVAKLCQNHGQRVQYSVFECLLEPAQWVELRAKLLALSTLTTTACASTSGSELAAARGTHRSQARLQPGRSSDPVTRTPSTQPNPVGPR